MNCINRHIRRSDRIFRALNKISGIYTGALGDCTPHRDASKELEAYHGLSLGDVELSPVSQSFTQQFIRVYTDSAHDKHNNLIT